MVENWVDATADRIAAEEPPPSSMVLFLGDADTGKTTLLLALASRLAHSRTVALVDGDIGQSHIGPPTTVGWTLWDQGCRPAPPPPDVPAVPEARGIAFVGDVTPVGHLLQLTAALAICVEQARQAADVVLIDTPGLVTGGAARALWWTVQRLLRPQRIVAIQRADDSRLRRNDLAHLLRGLNSGLSSIDLVQAPSELRRKSPEVRREHRNGLWARYFKHATVHTLDLKDVAVRTMRKMAPEATIGRVVGLADADGQDLAVGAIEWWRHEKAEAIIRAPGLDIRRVRCLTIGNVQIDMGRRTGPRPQARGDADARGEAGASRDEGCHGQTRLAVNLERSAPSEEHSQRVPKRDESRLGAHTSLAVAPGETAGLTSGCGCCKDRDTVVVAKLGSSSGCVRRRPSARSAAARRGATLDATETSRATATDFRSLRNEPRSRLTIDDWAPTPSSPPAPRPAGPRPLFLELTTWRPPCSIAT